MHVIIFIGFELLPVPGSAPGLPKVGKGKGKRGIAKTCIF